MSEDIKKCYHCFWWSNEKDDLGGDYYKCAYNGEVWSSIHQTACTAFEDADEAIIANKEW